MTMSSPHQNVSTMTTALKIKQMLSRDKKKNYACILSRPSASLSTYCVHALLSLIQMPSAQRWDDNNASWPKRTSRFLLNVVADWIGSNSSHTVPKFLPRSIYPPSSVVRQTSEFLIP